MKILSQEKKVLIFFLIKYKNLLDFYILSFKIIC